MTPREAAFRLTLVITALGTIASAAGLFAPDVYRETEWVLPQVRGQDLVTLVAMPILVLAALRGRREHSDDRRPARHVRARLAWAGLLGYVLYTYTAASFSYRFNELFLVYVALFSCSLFGLAALGTGMDADEVGRSFDTGLPRRALVVLLAIFAGLLTILWVGQIVPFLVNGTLPELIVRAETPTNFVYVLDLGVIVPLAVLAARWLGSRRSWGYVLTGAVLIKAATMGLALISMTWFSVLAGTDADPYLAVVWVLIAGSSLAGAYVFFRHCAPPLTPPNQEETA